MNQPNMRGTGIVLRAARASDRDDLTAGASDPMVARLPGGHTSKRVTNGLFENRDVDAVVLLLAPRVEVGARWQEAAFARAVEARVAELPAVASFAVRDILPLGGTQQSYVAATREKLPRQRLPDP